MRLICGDESDSLSAPALTYLLRTDGESQEARSEVWILSRSKEKCSKSVYSEKLCVGPLYGNVSSCSRGQASVKLKGVELPSLQQGLLRMMFGSEDGLDNATCTEHAVHSFSGAATHVMGREQASCFDIEFCTAHSTPLAFWFNCNMLRLKCQQEKAGDLFRNLNGVQLCTMGRLVPVLHDVLHHQHADGLREIKSVTPETRVIIILVATGRA